MKTIPTFDATNYKLTHFFNDPNDPYNEKGYIVEWSNEQKATFFVIVVALPDGSNRCHGKFFPSDRKVGDPTIWLDDDLCIQLVNAALALKGGEPINA